MNKKNHKQLIEEQIEEFYLDHMTCSCCHTIDDLITLLQSYRDKYGNKYTKLYFKDYVNYEYVDIHLMGVRKETDEEQELRLAQENEKQEKKNSEIQSKINELMAQLDKENQ